MTTATSSTSSTAAASSAAALTSSLSWADPTTAATASTSTTAPLPSSSLSSTANRRMSSYVLDPDAVIRRASSIPRCQYVPVHNKKTEVAVTTASSSTPSSMIFPGVSVRRAAFQTKSTATSSSNSNSNSSINRSNNNNQAQQAQEETPRVLSFLVTSSSPEGGSNDPEMEGGEASVGTLARVTVFVDTGTICTSRLWQGKVRHVFRRNVTTLDAVERLLKHPPALTPVDHTIVGLGDDDDDDDDDDSNDEESDDSGAENGRSHGGMVKNPIRVLQSELELAHVGVAILESEKAKLEHHLQAVVEHQQQQQTHQSHGGTGAAKVPAGATAAGAVETTATGAAGLAGAHSLFKEDAIATSPTPPNSSSQAPFAAAKAALVAGAKAGLKVSPPPSSPTAPATTAASTGTAPATATSKLPPPPPKKWDPPAPLSAASAAAGPTAATNTGIVGGSAASVGSALTAAGTAATTASVGISKDIGMEFQFSLSASIMKHVDQCMSDITGMNKLIKGVATNGRGTVFLYGNGGVAYTPNIPRPLHHKLSQLRSNTKMSSRPSYVSLGSKDRFYCAFHDGTYCVRGPKSLEKELKKCYAEASALAGASGSSSVASAASSSVPSMLRSHQMTPPAPHLSPASMLLMPVSVAFGSTWEAWFVVYGDGNWKFQGKIPTDLSNKLASRKDRGDLVRVTLGPSGEWFVKARNGRMWWGGLTDAADISIQRLLKDHELCFLDFGEDGSYFVSYD